MADSTCDTPGAARGVSALIVVDMISSWRFPDAGQLLPTALAIAPAIAALQTRFRTAGLPVIYANDHEGQWRSDWKQQSAAALAAGGDGARIAEQLEPDADDYFVLKPSHCAFYATPLQLLLERLDVRRLVLCGVTSDQCVLATALAAHMRGYDVTVPRDVVASLTPERSQAALRYFEDVLALSIITADRLP
jgi:nicotinamidase-related amidase